MTDVFRPIFQISILENELKTNTASEQEAKVKLCREHATAIERMYNECETEKGKVYNETRAEKAKMRCDFMIEKGKLIEEFMAEKEKMLKEFQAEKVQMLKKSMHVDRYDWMPFCSKRWMFTVYSSHFHML